ncbi:hypothetical protein CWI36_1455p0010 [Hamiltosporidium magnivora]|uniref:Uncharacterized protein n=1 Tax=Hamiltosporidium magnivora TaxID=148818 RepID=A0A4Q9L201_9MICR|nr:hypothetical protein CWI36_1455p0010 [Hamiltosporidium magnivora]
MLLYYRKAFGRLVIIQKIMKPVQLYTSETLVMTRRDEALLEIWERKIPGRTYGRIFENNKAASRILRAAPEGKRRQWGKKSK